MALTIVQKPLYKLLSAGQKIIFAVSDPVIVAAQTRVKYKAEVVLYDDAGTISPLAATLKTTPNNAGSGITGDIDFTTVGHGSGDAYTVVLTMVKSYG